MTKIQDTVDKIAYGLHQADFIDKRTLRELMKEEPSILHEYTGDEIRELRLQQHLSQTVFAKYLNVSPAMIRSLEQGKRHAQGTILKLLNIFEKHGLAGLV